MSEAWAMSVVWEWSLDMVEGLVVDWWEDGEGVCAGYWSEA